MVIDVSAGHNGLAEWCDCRFFLVYWSRGLNGSSRISTKDSLKGESGKTSVDQEHTGSL